MGDSSSHDVSEAHLRWLAQSRCDNQNVTLDLYLAIKNNAAYIERNDICAVGARVGCNRLFAVESCVFE